MAYRPDEKLLQELGAKWADEITAVIRGFFRDLMPTKALKDDPAVDDFATKATQSQFTAALMLAGKTVFPDGFPKMPDGYYLDNSPLSCQFQRGNLNAYDVYKLNSLLDIYNYICVKYDKALSMMSFTYLSNIPYETLEKWENSNPMGGDVTAERFRFTKRLREMMEDSYINLLTTGKRQPVGLIAVANRRFGWARDDFRQALGATAALPADSLPRLCSTTPGVEEAQA